MDAKPQRPLLRAMRVHNDENMPPLASGPIGKTLHQRTKSTSALGSAFNKKKVLGETNANLRVAPKDDSEIGKASPGKIRITQEPIASGPTATFHRPAVRPQSKSSAGQEMHISFKTQPLPSIESQPKKVVPKKSKVLKDVLPVGQPEANANDSNVLLQSQTSAGFGNQLPTLAPKPSTKDLAAQHQELHRTESVPLRDEPIPRPQIRSADVIDPENIMPQVLAPFSHHHNYLRQPAVQPQVPFGSVLPIHDQAFQKATQPADQDVLKEDFDDGDQDYVTAQSFDLRGDATETTIFNPQHNKKHRAELAEARAWVEANRTADDIEDEQWDTSMVAEYGDEIFEYMREMETRMAPNPYYMEQQQEIQWSMRAVLMDWVVQVHQRFNLLPETLFLTINYIDRFLSCKIVSLGKLQLVGATAIFVAAKYEEVNCPTISEIIYMVDNGYTADELLKAERFMLTMLQFELGWPGPMSFLRRISKADDYDLETRTLAKYFLEVTIMDERFVGCKPSFLAAGAHCMARLMLQKGEWTKAHVYYSSYTYRQLHRLLGAIFECCTEAKNHHSAVFEKYTDKRYKRASTFVHGEMMKGFQLPFNHRSSSTCPQHTTTDWLLQ